MASWLRIDFPFGEPILPPEEGNCLCVCVCRGRGCRSIRGMEEGKRNVGIVGASFLLLVYCLFYFASLGRFLRKVDEFDVSSRRIPSTRAFEEGETFASIGLRRSREAGK